MAGEKGRRLAKRSTNAEFHCLMQPSIETEDGQGAMLGRVWALDSRKNVGLGRASAPAIRTPQDDEAVGKLFASAS